MKHQLLAGAAVAALALAPPAIAAPVQSPALIVYNWTGFYAGANFGYSWGVVESSFHAPGLGRDFAYGGLPGTFPASQNLNNFIGGVQAGHNWQINNAWVFGVEADIQASAERNGIAIANIYSCDSEGPTTCTLRQSRDARIAWFGTVRGRIGALITPTTFLYGTGGLAYGKVSFSNLVSDPEWSGMGFLFQKSKINIGYAVGGGLESYISGSRDWTWKFEYLYLDLGSISGSGMEPIYETQHSWKAKFIDHILRIGINRKIP